MPFFGHKFTPIKLTVRQKLPFHNSNNFPVDNNDKIIIKIGNNECLFNEGEWKNVGVDDIYSGNGQLHKMSQLNEENSLLKLKIDILLDMLTEELCKADQWERTNYRNDLKDS